MKRLAIVTIPFLILSLFTLAQAQNEGIDLSWDFGLSKNVYPCSPLCVDLQVMTTQTGFDIDIYVIAEFFGKYHYLPSFKSKYEIFKTTTINEEAFTIPVLDCINIGEFDQNFDVKFYAVAAYAGTLNLASNILSETLKFIPHPKFDDKYDEVDAYISQTIDYYNLVGASIAIFSSCDTLYSKGYGLKKYGDDDVVDSQTQFRIASLTKMGTAAAAMTLHDDGLLDLQEPVTEYVPYFNLYYPFDPDEITPHMCLAHTSGLMDYYDYIGSVGVDGLSNWFKVYGSDVPLWSPPGRLWNYSNLGYDLAGLVVEEISGQPFPEYMKLNIFERLGMNSSTYLYSDVVNRKNYAIGHTHDAYGNVDTSGYYDPNSYGSAVDNPAGGLFSTTEDMARFGRMLLTKGQDVLTQDSVATMSGNLVETHFTPDDYYGYGLAGDNWDPLKSYGHTGSLPGFLTAMQIFPEQNFGVVIFLNSRIYSPTALLVNTVQILLDYNCPDPPDYSTPPETWSKYVGEYLDPYGLGRANIIQEEDNTLWADLLDFEAQRYTDGPVQLYQHAGDTFYFYWEYFGTYVYTTFWLDENGNGEFFATRSGTAERLESKNLINFYTEEVILNMQWIEKIKEHPEIIYDNKFLKTKLNIKMQND